MTAREKVEAIWQAPGDHADAHSPIGMTGEAVVRLVEKQDARIAELEAEVADLRAQLESRPQAPLGGACGYDYHHKDCDCGGAGGAR